MTQTNESPEYPGRFIAYFRYAMLGEIGKGVIMPLWLAPFFFTGALLLWGELKKNDNYRQDPNILFIAFSMLMFVAGLVLATQIVFDSRYWHFLFEL